MPHPAECNYSISFSFSIKSPIKTSSSSSRGFAEEVLKSLYVDDYVRGSIDENSSCYKYNELKSYLPSQVST